MYSFLGIYYQRKLRNVLPDYWTFLGRGTVVPTDKAGTTTRVATAVRVVGMLVGVVAVLGRAVV